MPKSESVKRESIPIVPVDIFGHTHRPLLVEETALMDKYAFLLFANRFQYFSQKQQEITDQTKNRQRG